MARLGWRALQGYLRGFIDAVFFDGQRYFLLDYKSNHLGSHQADYLPDRLVEPMIEHDYVLQYLIYTVALDRYLAHRQPGYSYEEHFGGVIYVFLRGLERPDPAGQTEAPTTGWWVSRPDVDRIRDLDRLLADSTADLRPRGHHG